MCGKDKIILKKSLKSKNKKKAVPGRDGFFKLTKLVSYEKKSQSTV